MLAARITGEDLGDRQQRVTADGWLAHVHPSALPLARVRDVAQLLLRRRAIGARRLGQFFWWLCFEARYLLALVLIARPPYPRRRSRR